MRVPATAILFILFTAAQTVTACSAFMLKNDSTLIAAKNYDWEVENGMVIVNKRGIQKTALADTLPLSWTSKYGSITFNQYGQEFPIGGMNEKGLVIEALWLNETIYPPVRGALPRIDNMQWIQYQLDNAATIEEVIAHDSALQIAPLSPTAVHCFITDRSGNALIFESIDGTLRHYRTDAESLPILTNDPYKHSMRMLRKCSFFGGNLKVPSGKGSITRFIHLGIALDSAKNVSGTAHDKAFRILKHVTIGSYTKWSIVYDIRNMTITFRSKSGKKRKTVRFSKVAFDCSGPTLAVPLISGWSGDISARFRPFTVKENAKLVGTSIRKTRFLKHMPPEAVSVLAGAPSENRCE